MRHPCSMPDYQIVLPLLREWIGAISKKKIIYFVFSAIFVICDLPATQAQTQESTSAQVEALQKKLDSLQNQMTEVQAEINKLSGAPPAATPSNGTIDTQQAGRKTEVATELGTGQQNIGQATTTYETTSQDPVAAPRIDNEPLDPRYPGYFRLPGTRTFLKIGGYFKTDFIYDLKPAGDAERFIPSSIPTSPQPGVNNATVSIRPTRLNLDFLIPTEKFNVRFFLEGDLFGSNATTPRLRHAYAQVKNLLIGQTFSNFMDPDTGPDQLDFQGPNAQLLIRTPQIRYGFKIRPKTTFTIAVEKPSSDIDVKVQGFTAQPNSPSPDGTLQLRREMNSGHVQLAALFRSVSGFVSGSSGPTDSVFAWGFNLTGSRKIGKDTTVYQVEYGNGIERYLNDTSGTGSDAALMSASHPGLRPLPVVGAYGAYQHYWIPKVRSSVIYGFAQVQNTDFQSGTAFHQSNYAAGNLIWNPIGSLNVGAEFLYGWRVNKDGSSGNAPRIMLSAKYNFVRGPETKKTK